MSDHFATLRSKELSTKQHFGNIWGSLHWKVKQHWGWFEKEYCLQKRRALHHCIFSPNKWNPFPLKVLQNISQKNRFPGTDWNLNLEIHHMAWKMVLKYISLKSLHEKIHFWTKNFHLENDMQHLLIKI